MIKTRLQNQTRSATGQLKYRNGFDCARKLLAEEGLRGFYRGMPANLIGITPEKAIKLAVNDYTRYYFALSEYRKKEAAGATNLRFDTDSLPIWQGMVAGASAGLCQVVVTNPMEVTKINSQMAVMHAKATGQPVQSSWSIVKELGLKGLYRGTPATLLRDVPFSFIFFPLSSVWKKMIADRDRARGGDGKVPIAHVFVSGVVAGSVAAFSVTPADVIKTRLQTRRAVQAGEVQYKGIADVARHVYHTGGLTAFFRGGIQRVMIVSPLFGITLLVYEAQQRYLASK
jgi:hypothetical protein